LRSRNSRHSSNKLGSANGSASSIPPPCVWPRRQKPKKKTKKKT
jgi:hypothetical protein